MRRALVLALAGALATGAAQAQQPDVEARLREALRRTTADLRAVQDGQARLQAEAAEARAQRDQALAGAQAKDARIAELEAAAPAARPPDLSAELDRWRAAALAFEQQNAALRSALVRAQGAFAEAASVARAKEAERALATGALRQARLAIDASEAKNAALLTAAMDTLKLYEQPDFRRLLLGSYEPLLGFQRVKLENIVQEHADRIQAGRFHAEAMPVPAVPEASALPANLATRPARAARRQP